MQTPTNEEVLAMVEENPDWLEEWLDEDMTGLFGPEPEPLVFYYDAVSPVHPDWCNIFYVLEYWDGPTAVYYVFRW